ncbi:MAG: hypothetical protein ACK56F_27690, partial [bacterium]
MPPRRSITVRHRCRTATPLEEVANDLGTAALRRTRAARTQTTVGRESTGGVEAARAHTERVRPARAGVAHDPARGAIIA